MGKIFWFKFQAFAKFNEKTNTIFSNFYIMLFSGWVR